jgi:hypothetical protein
VVVYYIYNRQPRSRIPAAASTVFFNIGTHARDDALEWI